MQEKRLAYLFFRHIDGTATEVERHELNELLDQPELEPAFKKLMEESWETFAGDRVVFGEEQSAGMLKRAIADGSKQRAVPVLQPAVPARTPVRFLRKWGWAAAVILLFGGSILFLTTRTKKDTQLAHVDKRLKSTIAPAGNKATLILGDGSSIVLDSIANGSIARQGAARVQKTGDGQIVYTADVAGNSRQVVFNTMSTPRGGQYQLTLPDGSKVWLNAETKLRYPANFDGETKREIFLESGEAYFSVKRDAERPFVVRAGGMDIHVLGTEFNVNTYTKNCATTLVNGSVRLSAGDVATMLQPGQQGVYVEGGFTRRGVDLETYTAWKDGQMIFEESTLEEVMNSLGRQYDFTTEFTLPQMKTRKFGGRLRRTAHIEDVLAIIEKAGYVKFDIRGKTIFVSPGVSE
jgi:ferric-dicitrate binding protein FerR (iron transport regulator)